MWSSYVKPGSATKLGRFWYTLGMSLPDIPNPSSEFLSRQAIMKQLELETSQRLTRIDAELNDGYKIAHKYNDTITVFGSARFKPDHPHYQKAVEVAGALSKQGYTIVTGGGPGIMEAANRGAFEAGCPSVGLGIELPQEQGMNKYITDSLTFKYFFTRKVMLAFGADGYLFFPGGFGTFDELFEIITLVQTGKMSAVPIILVGVEYWRGLQAYIQLNMIPEQTISAGDENLYTITDDTDQIVTTLNNYRDHKSFAQQPDNVTKS